MLPRAGRSATFRHVQRRLQTTLAGETDAVDAILSNRIPQTTVDTRRGRKTVFVRPWSNLQSMQEALAIARELEKRFGRVRDVGYNRDIARPDVYAPYFWLDFNEESSAEAACAAQTVQVQFPIALPKQDGGPGLDDIRPYILPLSGDLDVQSSYYTPESESTTPSPSAEGEETPVTKVVDVRVERAYGKHLYRRNPEYSGIPKSRVVAFGVAFSKWGGFYQPRPSYVHPVDPTASTATSEHGPLMTEAQKHWQEYVFKSKSSQSTRNEGEESSTLVSGHAEAPEEPKEPVEMSAETSQASSMDPVSALAEEQPSTESHPEVPPDVEPSPTPPPIDTPSSRGPTPQQHPSGLTKRQRILAQARELAAKPLPEKLTLTPEQQREKEEKEKQAEEEQKVSLRNRLWKLFGGGQF
ncbi:hypothetical protein K474DRAFT_1771945 [Panus rudis PR-1116 ss-1]|nr:hypothetical protein K474DRAFT_1771945 [Panus rudis PR-1116 ss-1]